MKFYIYFVFSVNIQVAAQLFNLETKLKKENWKKIKKMGPREEKSFHAIILESACFTYHVLWDICISVKQKGKTVQLYLTIFIVLRPRQEKYQTLLLKMQQSVFKGEYSTCL